MITPTAPTEQLLFTTLRIEVGLKSDRYYNGVGTGFFFTMKTDDLDLSLVVTNKHVVQGVKKGRFWLHEAQHGADPSKPSGRFFTIEIENFDSFWFFHPDPNIDLCAMPFKPILDQAQEKGKSIFNVWFNERIILSDQLLERVTTAVEEVLFIGYPIGLWDERNKLPLIRRGITSSHPAVDFEGKPEFVIDAACLPGSSGSPVLLWRHYSEKERAQFLGTQLALLGVLYAAAWMTVEGSIVIKPVPTAVVSVIKTETMVHLGYVIKAKEIVTLGQHIIEEVKNKSLLSREIVEIPKL